MPSLFQSISSFFSTQRDQPHFSRDQAMVSVDDAFAIPPDGEYASGPNAYTYPPPARSGSYDTVSQSSYAHSPYDLRPSLLAGSSSGNRARPTLLPIHHSPLPPLPNYPPLQQTWDRLRSWLDDQYPELADTLNWGIQPPDLAHLELQLGFTLPPAVRESYLIVDGQEAESSAGCSEGLFFGLTLLPFEDVVDEWRFWREVDSDPATGANAELRENMRSIPPGWIRREYSQRGWLPLVADKAGNYLGVDMNPDERGTVGQVIIFGRDFDTKVVMWRGEGEAGWARWFASFVEELESGEGFEVGGVGEGSEGSEDSVGYESYFCDGSVGKGHGGGVGGVGGLRLTGEYRGWTVLEALADRSMRRWIDAGVMVQPTLLNEMGPPSHEAELGILDVEEGTSRSPCDDGQRDNWKASATQPNGDPGSSYTHSPSLSITKVPAPQPVQLPTEEDLLPSPTTSSPTETTSVYEQEEEMADLPMREVDRATPVQASYPSSLKEAVLVPLPSPTDASPSKSPSVPVDTFSEPSNLQIADPLNSQNLLADTIPTPFVPPIVTVSPSGLEGNLSSAILTPPAVDESANHKSSATLAEDEVELQPVIGGDTVTDSELLVDGLPAANTPEASAPGQKKSLSGLSTKRTKEAV